MDGTPRVSLNQSPHKFHQISAENEIEFGVAKCENCGVECLIDNNALFYYNHKGVGDKIASSSCEQLLVEAIIDEWTNTI